MISAEKNPIRAEFVVQECLNKGTRTFVMYGEFAEFYPVLTSPRFDRYINPTKRFPNLKLAPIDPDDDFDDNHCIGWINVSDRDDEELEVFRDFWGLVEA